MSENVMNKPKAVPLTEQLRMCGDSISLEAAEAIAVLEEQLRVATARSQAWRDLCKELYKHSNKCMGMLGEAVPCLRAQRGSIPQHLAADINAYVESAFIQTPAALREECSRLVTEEEHNPVTDGV